MAVGNAYELRLYDRTLLEFSIVEGLFGPEVEVHEVDWSARDIMPCGLAPTPDGIWRWLETRSIPTNRRNAGRICRELGFELGDLEALYRTSLGLSLNDSYWVVPRGFAGRFDDYNLFENPFSEAIGALAVAGELRGSALSGNTPELTTDGTLQKGWRIVDGVRTLYKGASEGFVPGEPTSEYLSSLVACDLGLDAVTYGLDTWQGEECSTCACFSTRELSYVPYAIATGSTDLVSVLWWAARLGCECLETLCDMFALDALLCNTDRHLTNFGVLRENVTGRAVGLAPIFDNGRALFPNVAEDDAMQFALEAELRGPAFGGQSFGQLLARTMGLRQRKLLERAAARGVVGNVLVRGRRVAAIDTFMRRRAEELAGIPVVNHEELVEALEGVMAHRRVEDDGVCRLTR